MANPIGVSTAQAAAIAAGDATVTAAFIAADAVVAANAGVFVLMASKTGVDGHVLASTNLTFATGITNATHVPVLVVFKFASGVLGASVAKIKNSAATISALTALLAAVSGTEVSALISGTIINSGSLTVEVTTISVAASTFDVFVYGTVRP